MRRIDADALKKALKSNCKPELCHDYNSAWCESCCPHNEFEDLIDEAPTVEERSYAMGYQDGAEDGLQGIRTEGKWIDNSEDYGYVECPFCHKATTCEDNIDELHYCWNCGTKLGKEVKKNDTQD